MPAEPWVSVECVACNFGVSHDTVYRRIQGKGLPAHALGRPWKFKPADLDAWVRRGGASDEPARAEDRE